jgi:hypothetical protein
MLSRKFKGQFTLGRKLPNTIPSLSRKISFQQNDLGSRFHFNHSNDDAPVKGKLEKHHHK